MPLVDNAIYVEGIRTETPGSLDETFELIQGRRGMAWIGLYRPDDAEVDAVAAEFDLHHLAVEDARNGHQRAKLERFGETLFVVLRPARYLPTDDRVEFGELHMFLGPGFVVTIRHAESPDLGAVRRRLEDDPDRLALGPQAILHAVLDQVVDEYGPVMVELQRDIDEIEDELFGEHADVSRRIYELLREVIAFQRAVQPLVGILEELLRGADRYRVDIELHRALRDVHDHVLRIVDQADAFRVLLQNSLTVHATLVGQRQNDEMRGLTEASLALNEETQRLTETSLAQNEEIKKISSWAAILFAPTLIGTIYGMNFEHMPELSWVWGYPLSIAAMGAMGVTLYLIFRHKRWL